MGGGLKPGINNAFSNGPAIYCTPDINYALHYSNAANLSNQISEDGVDLNNVRMIFQCRVNPKNLYEHDENTWYVYDYRDIRPYRICL